MAGLRSEVDILFLSLWESGNVRIVQYPNTVAGINVVSDGAAVAGAWAAYVQIVAAAAIANPCWILGIVLGTPQVEAFYGDIAIASGAAAAEVDLAVVGVGTDTFAVVEWFHPTIWLPYPIKVAGSPRLACRLRKNTGASASGFANCNIVAAVGVGT